MELSLPFYPGSKREQLSGYFREECRDAVNVESVLLIASNLTSSGAPAGRRCNCDIDIATEVD